MNDTDTQLIQEAMDDMYGTKGVYEIKVRLVDGNGQVVEETSSNVSGDEAAWQKFQDIKEILIPESEIDAMMGSEAGSYPSASNTM